MRDRIDPLIAERAPWLFRGQLHTEAARKALTGILGYSKTLHLGETFRDMPPHQIMDYMGRLLAKDVGVQGLEHIPISGPALIVANHPTGIADGIILNHILRRVRSDNYYFANSDILRVLPQLSSLIVPVEWRPEKRTREKTRATMIEVRDQIAKAHLGVIFPAGRLAKRRGLQLFERPWMASAAMIARKFDLPVIPVNIRARNSVLFYLFDLLHPTLRDITLFYETLNKSRQPFRITMGKAIAPGDLPASSEEAIEVLRSATLALGGTYAPAVSLIDNSRQKRWLQTS